MARRNLKKYHIAAMPSPRPRDVRGARLSGGHKNLAPAAAARHPALPDSSGCEGLFIDGGAALWEYQGGGKWAEGEKRRKKADCL